MASCNLRHNDHRLVIKARTNSRLSRMTSQFVGEHSTSASCHDVTVPQNVFTALWTSLLCCAVGNSKLQCIDEEGMCAGLHWSVQVFESMRLPNDRLRQRKIFLSAIYSYLEVVSSMVVPDHWIWMRCWIALPKGFRYKPPQMDKTKTT